MWHSGNQRWARGEELPHAKLTDDDVRLIRQLGEHRRELLDEARKISDAALADKFGVSRATISEVIHYRKWRHVA